MLIPMNATREKSRSTNLVKVVAVNLEHGQLPRLAQAQLLIFTGPVGPVFVRLILELDAQLAEEQSAVL